MLPNLRWVLIMQALAVILGVAFLVSTNPFSDGRVSSAREVVQRMESVQTDEARSEAIRTLGQLVLNRAEATRAARRRACGFVGGITLLLVANTLLLWRSRNVVYSSQGVEIRTL